MHYGERLNSYSHLAGGIIAFAGVLLLNAAAIRSGSSLKILGSLVYGSTIVSMFLVSTLYHAARGTQKQRWRKLDHIAIFVLIAGTYTPFCLLPLRDSSGPWLLPAVWALALLGTLLEFKLAHRSRLPSFALYFVMAFLALAAFPGLNASLPEIAILWIKSGFWCYGLGFGFYVLDKKFRERHLHGIWHLFVIAGAFCQYVSIALVVGVRPLL